jgi:archaellum biogenesis protein FlaJ (TadC family)
MTEIPESLMKAATVYPYLLFLSVLFLLATVLVYVLLPPLRDANGIMIMSYVSSMAIYYTGLGIIQIVPEMPKTVCASLRKRNHLICIFKGRA